MARYPSKVPIVLPGMLSAPEAARMLGLTPETICEWCKEALSNGPSSVLPKDAVQRDFAGRYWVRELAIVDLIARREMCEW